MAGWTRRGFTTGALSLATAPAWAQGLSFHVPDGACDAHHHIYDPRFPYIAAKRLQPPATVDDYWKFQKTMGTSRDVIVLPSAYGFNNDPLFYFQGRMGETTRSIAVIRADADARLLEDLNAVGVRGVRIQFSADGTGFFRREDIDPIARRIAPLGWHVQFHMPGALLAELQSLILGLPVPVVIDHMGHATAVDQPQYRTVRKLLDTGRGWIKVSGLNMGSAAGAPGYGDTVAVAKTYIRANLERVLWGSNWPNPGENPVPDVINVLNALAAAAESPAALHRILVANPEALFGFDPKRRPAAH